MIALATLIIADIATQIGPWFARIGLLLLAIVLCLVIALLIEAAIVALHKWWNPEDDG